jgi:hypothetical protein
MNDSQHFMKRLFRFYYDGFRNMSQWGKKVWIIIIIKLFIIFAILRLFFFPDFLKKNFDTDTRRSEYVLDQLINSPENHD